MCAFSVAMFTVAATSGNLFNTFSRRAEHDAQCMPVICRSMWVGLTMRELYAHLAGRCPGEKKPDRQNGYRANGRGGIMILAISSSGRCSRRKLYRLDNILCRP